MTDEKPKLYKSPCSISVFVVTISIVSISFSPFYSKFTYARDWANNSGSRLAGWKSLFRFVPVQQAGVCAARNG